MIKSASSSTFILLWICFKQITSYCSLSRISFFYSVSATHLQLSGVKQLGMKYLLRHTVLGELLEPPTLRSWSTCFNTGQLCLIFFSKEIWDGLLFSFLNNLYQFKSKLLCRTFITIPLLSFSPSIPNDSPEYDHSWLFSPVLNIKRNISQTWNIHPINWKH